MKSSEAQVPRSFLSVNLTSFHLLSKDLLFKASESPELGQPFSLLCDTTFFQGRASNWWNKEKKRYPLPQREMTPAKPFSGLKALTNMNSLQFFNVSLFLSPLGIYTCASRGWRSSHLLPTWLTHTQASFLSGASQFAGMRLDAPPGVHGPCLLLFLYFYEVAHSPVP